MSTSNPLGTVPGPKSRPVKKKKAGVRNIWTGNRDFTGFKQLNSLSLLGISSLDYLDEISGCLKASTTSLKSLALSLSHETAQKARKVSAAPPPVEDATSDDEEDEELIDPPTPPPPPPASNALPTLPTRTEADVRKEKQAQEAILAKIFDMEQHSGESKRLERNLIMATGKQEPQIGIKNVLRDVKALAQKLAEAGSEGANDPSIAREAVEMVHKSTAQYLNKNPVAWKAPASWKGASSGPSKLSFAQTQNTLPPFPSSTAPGSLSSAPNGPSSKAVWGPDSTGGSFNWDGYKAFQDLAKLKEVDINSIMSMSDADWASAQGGESFPPWPSPGAPKGQDKPPSHPASGFSSPGTTTPMNEISSSTANLTNHQPLPTSSSTPSSSLLQMQSASESHQDINLTTHPNGTKTPPLPELSISVDPAPSTGIPIDDSGDVDMIHPDEDPTELIADQEMISDEEETKKADAEEAGTQSPRKRVRFGPSKENGDADESESTTLQTSKQAGPGDDSTKQEESPEEVMQAWIRETHGYQLEEVKLNWIPMRAGILSRALDLAVLQRITLLNCGSQDGFWVILAGFQARQGTIALQSIHTDNVSKNLLKFLRSFDGLTELFLHERKKNHSEAAAAAAQPKIGITEIRRQGLRKHIKTLKRMMIKNEHDASWDLDAVTISLLSMKGSNLVELAVSLGALPFVSVSSSLITS